MKNKLLKEEIIDKLLLMEDNIDISRRIINRLKYSQLISKDDISSINVLLRELGYNKTDVAFIVENLFLHNKDIDDKKDVIDLDDKYKFIGEKKFIKCDTVILSVGLIPETDLVQNLVMHKRTNCPEVDDYFITSETGVFACGNFLHVHDLVDNVTLESINAGSNAAEFALGVKQKGKKFSVTAGNKLSYDNPSFAHSGSGKFAIRFRLKERFDKKWMRVVSNGVVLAKKFVLAGLPGEMQTLEVNRADISGDLLVEVDDG